MPSAGFPAAAADSPKVSVCLITYNHAPFLAQAIESVVSQITNFRFELVIGEDCSPDNSRDIIARYQARYPDLIRLITSPHNVGAQANALRTLNACRGQYLAHVEGDDYWLDSGKLQKQVDFLDRNPDFALCFHNVYDEDATTGHRTLHNKASQPRVTTLEDLAASNYIATVSSMHRRVLPAFPAWLRDVSAGDYTLHMLHAQYGKIGYLPEVMAVYRLHAQSAWQSKSDVYRLEKWFTTLGILCQHFTGAVHERLRSSQLLALRELLEAPAVETAVKADFLARYVTQLTDLVGVIEPLYEKGRLAGTALEHRLVAGLVRPLRKLLRK